MTKGNIKETVAEYKGVMQKPLRPRTVTFLVRDGEVLVGLKRRGFGQGNYLGIGGKVEDDKDRTDNGQDKMAVIKSGAMREIDEEIGVIVEPGNLQSMGVLRFCFPHVADESWNQEVYVFVVKTWQGEPLPKEDISGEIEIEPAWFKISEVPLEKMWDDARYWLPLILRGQKVEGEFVFDKTLKVVDHIVR